METTEYMDYAYKLTTHGRNVMAACMALEKPLKITRVAFGAGKVDKDVNLADVHELLEYVSDGAVTERHHKDDRFYLTLQYVNSMHPDVKMFFLSEFIVYAMHPETGEETDLIYGTQGDYRQPVPAYHPAYPPSVFNFPLELILSSELSVSISAPAGLVTWDDLTNFMSGKITGTTLPLAIPASSWVPDEDTGGAYALHLDVPNTEIAEDMVPVLTVLPESQTAAAACGLCSTARTLPGILRLYAKTAPTAELNASLTLLGSVRDRKEITIPVTGWTTATGTYPLYLDIPGESIAADLIPMLIILPESLEAAANCGLSPSVETLDGALRLKAKKAPAEEMRAQLTLIGSSAGLTSGAGDGYRIGHGLKVENGTLSVDAADDFQGDTTLPMTAGGVETVVGNIEALLGTI